MGYGLPAAVAAKIIHPERQVVCVAGDGDLMMSIQELATAPRSAGFVVIVFNNGMYGTIRMHQEMHFPARVLGTELRNPDFVALAQSFGLKAWLVSDTAQFSATLLEALASPTGGLIELTIDPEAITPRTTLAALRAR
jgi:acetolactate synthase I/II/III large subunit